jgi:GNAT superfamily N-acetyltransferase
VNLKPILASTFIEFLRQYPGCDNYRDVLLAENQNLAAFKFYSLSSRDLIAISPEQNFHLYSMKPNIVFEVVLAIKESEFGIVKNLFSFTCNKPLIEKELASIIKDSKPFKYLNKIPKNNFSESGLDFRLANVENQTIVNDWYNAFNHEEGSNWLTPNLASDLGAKLYLMFKQNTLIGCVANTLKSDSRFWIGRMWVPPAYRRLGYGLKMLSFLERESFIQNKKMALLVSSSNKRAIQLYNKVGFKEKSENCFWTLNF